MPELADPEPLQPDIVIYYANNHHIIRARDWDNDGEWYTAAFDDDAAFLLTIAEACCDLGNRYSAKRLTIGYQPGDKHHDLHPKPCSECECGCEP